MSCSDSIFQSQLVSWHNSPYQNSPKLVSAFKSYNSVKGEDNKQVRDGPKNINFISINIDKYLQHTFEKYQKVYIMQKCTLQHKNINKQQVQQTKQKCVPQNNNIFKQQVEIKQQSFPQPTHIQRPQEEETRQNTSSKKKLSLKKSNAYKNFLNRFRLYFSNNQNVKDLFKDNQQQKKQYKNIKDNLNKKIKYEKRAQTIQNIKSILSHENYMRILLIACQRYTKLYPKQIKESKKMPTQNKVLNTQIIKDIIKVIQELQQSLQ